MSVQVKGMQELIDYYDKIGDKKTPKKALRKAGDHVLKVEKRVAESKHYKYSRRNGDSGKNHLKRFPVWTRNNQFFVDIGIKGKENKWKQVRGLYFNHYGFYHNGWHKKNTRKRRLRGEIYPKYIAGTRWMDVAFTQSNKEAYDIFSNELMEGLK